MKLQTIEVGSPIGRVTAAVGGGRLYALGFSDRWPALRRILRAQIVDVELTSGLAHGRVARGIEQYFAGKLDALDGVDVELLGTPFQCKVWNALREIPAGQTESYGALARRIGAPEAARGVGAACGANLIWLALPCHRVISANGQLAGYAGGVDRKRWLLAHERQDLFGPKLL